MHYKMNLCAVEIFAPEFDISYSSHTQDFGFCCRLHFLFDLLKKIYGLFGIWT